ncbi:MAG: cation:proton antiporter [Methylotetracoccus sp.]|jgi:CPA2 family monovalent cation:H+ antiporter-2|nr:cation:proton antiporter [Methylotetracoccus sp.]
MEHHYPDLFGELLVIFIGSLISVVVFQRLRLPDTLAYLFTGALIGPFGLAWIKDTADIKFLSELGLVFLLFELGLEFSLPRLMSLGRAVFGLGSMQVGGTILVFGAINYFRIGLSWQSALDVAGALSLSSTAVVVRELKTYNLTNRHHAQLAIGVLIFQDLAAVIGLILIQAFGGDHSNSLPQQMLVTLEKGTLLVLLLLGAGKWLLPPVFHEIAKTRSEEVFVLTVLVVILLSAWVTNAFGLSMALGAFLTGVMLGENEFRHQVELDIRPFKDILMGLFFASVGMQLNFGLLADASAARVVVLGILLLVVIKTLLTTLFAMLLGESMTTGTKTGLILAQASEFGFALIILSRELGVISNELSSHVLIIALGSIVLAPWLVRYSFEISQFLARLAGQSVSPRDREFSRVSPHLTDHVILAGYGRVGQLIGKFLRANDVPFIALDTDAQVVKQARLAGDLIIYGSCQRVELLKRCHMERARLAILTFKSLKDACRVVAQIRALGYKCPIVVRTQHEGNYAELLAAGANYVIPEMLESSLMMAAEVMTLLGFPKAVVDEQVLAERNLHKSTQQQ